MPLTRLMRRELHRGGKESILVARDVAFQKADDVAGGRHLFPLRVGLGAATAVGTTVYGQPCVVSQKLYGGC